ncbi:NAD(P)H-dependent oxidoreductase [Streptomyces sp. NPDC026672]|uniref:NADPH-dependent FMN reductase n=1 Tax=unclassified Streptomyces TaxID=2593676 RepID=UPI0033DD4528
MSTPMPATAHRTLVLSGSLRTGSVTTQIARTALTEAGPGHEVVLATGLDALPLFNEDLDTDHPLPQIAALRAQVGAADSLFVLSPVNNAAISAVLKNTLDWLSRPRDHAPLTAKPATGLLVGYHSHGAEHHLNAVLRATGAVVVPGPTPMLGLRSIDQRDIARDPRVRRTVAQALACLVPSEPTTA